MFLRSLTVVLLVMLSLITISCQAELPPLEGEVTDLGEEFFACLLEGDYDRCVDFFAPKMKRAMSARKLAQSWEGLLKQTGPFVDVLDIRKVDYEEYEFVIFTIEFEFDYVDLRLVFNEDRRIAGLWYDPPSLTE